MSLFKSKGIILKITKIKDKNFVYDIFTYDYWKIKVQKKNTKKEKNLDLWYIINCEIETKQWRDIHKIKNIKIKSEFDYENKNFAVLNTYLEIISYVEKNLTYWADFKDIFEIIEIINNKKNIDDTKLVLAKLKITNYLWELNIENNDKNVEKILKFINKNKISEILKLTWIDNDLKIKLKNLYKNYS